MSNMTSIAHINNTKYHNHTNSHVQTFQQIIIVPPQFTPSGARTCRYHTVVCTNRTLHSFACLRHHLPLHYKNTKIFCQSPPACMPDATRQGHCCRSCVAAQADKVPIDLKACRPRRVPHRWLIGGPGLGCDLPENYGHSRPATCTVRRIAFDTEWLN